MDSMEALIEVRAKLRAALGRISPPELELAGTFEKVQVARTREALNDALRATQAAITAMKGAL
jgi:hypothetical protein